MIPDRLQRQRYELKFQIAEATALGLRDFVRAYLEPDDFAVGARDFSYPVHSIYLDSEELGLYRATIKGDPNRFKLRVRYYGEAEASPVFFEIKRRLNDCIRKERAQVRRDRIAALLTGDWPGPDDVVRPDPGQLGSLRRFCEIAAEMQASPRSHVAYEREAWVSPGTGAVRVTFDRAVCSEPYASCEPTVRFAEPVEVFPGRVVLEIKFTDRYPNWIGEMIRAFDLVRSGAAKYAGGIALAGEDRFCAGARLGGVLASGLTFR